MGPGLGELTMTIIWAPGLGEIIILFILFCVFLALSAALFAGVSFLIKRLADGGKACPHCAERIKKAAKICRYCQLDVTGA